MNFRRCILAMMMLALFVGLASAQVNLSGAAASPNLTCNATVASPAQVRSEGMTELIGDIVITCTGGQALAVASLVPTANVTVSLGTNVTSRLLGTNGNSNSSEALLLVDEPHTDSSGASGAGPTQPFNLCANANVGAGPGGCQQYVNSSLNTATCTTFTSGVCTAFGAANNTFQGVVNANQVTFFGIPVNPPVSAGEIGRAHV